MADPLSARPRHPERPVVRVDEGGKPRVGDGREPLPVRPGSPGERDEEYARAGMVNVLVAVEPLAGRRYAEVTERKTSVGFARVLQARSDEHYPDADRIVRA